ncbi:MAG: helix-turn-helix domain-containing protein [Firmicutes bacterium]|nr:helix-turn-helix domain-containing protein [Bacillota bacterium]
MKEISERIFDLLKKQGKTQKEFSAFTNIKESAISQWKADGTNPRAENLAIIAKFFNVSSDYLLGLTDDQTPYYKQ